MLTCLTCGYSCLNLSENMKATTGRVGMYESIESAAPTVSLTFSVKLVSFARWPSEMTLKSAKGARCQYMARRCFANVCLHFDFSRAVAKRRAFLASWSAILRYPSKPSWIML